MEEKNEYISTQVMQSNETKEWKKSLGIMTSRKRGKINCEIGRVKIDKKTKKWMSRRMKEKGWLRNFKEGMKENGSERYQNNVYKESRNIGQTWRTKVKL